MKRVFISTIAIVILALVYVFKITGQQDEGIPAKTGTRFELSQEQISAQSQLANEGSIDAIWTLFRHYAFAKDDRNQSKYWAKRGAELEDPKFLLIYADRLLEESLEEKDLPRKRALLIEALSWANLAESKKVYGSAELVRRISNELNSVKM